VTALAQENEALTKRAAMFEEELQTADEQLKRYRLDLEQKSKIIQQYVLRDHEAALQPDQKPKTSKIGINILSSSGAMQKLDPVILANINMKMQKLLEDLTVKMMTMEEELKSMFFRKSFATMQKILQEAAAPYIDQLRTLLSPLVAPLLPYAGVLDLKVVGILAAIPCFLFLAWFSLQRPSYDPFIEPSLDGSDGSRKPKSSANR
ncbi:hypothetical protein HDU91_006955, partial [Kappamyces sp. JEL0680]